MTRLLSFILSHLVIIRWGQGLVTSWMHKYPLSSAHVLFWKAKMTPFQEGSGFALATMPQPRIRHSPLRSPFSFLLKLNEVGTFHFHTWKLVINIWPTFLTLHNKTKSLRGPKTVILPTVMEFEKWVVVKEFTKLPRVPLRQYRKRKECKLQWTRKWARMCRLNIKASNSKPSKTDKNSPDRKVCYNW